jgi:hypothetical protein
MNVRIALRTSGWELGVEVCHPGETGVFKWLGAIENFAASACPCPSTGRRPHVHVDVSLNHARTSDGSDPPRSLQNRADAVTPGARSGCPATRSPCVFSIRI